MDPLSISTGVAGLIGLALQVAPILHAYISDVASARTDIQTYLREVDALSQVSELLHSFLDTSAAADGQFQTTEAVLFQTIKSCETCLADLVRMLSKPTSLSRKLLWSMEKQKVESIMERLRRYTQLFHFALSVEGWAVLSQTPAEVTAILEMQMQMSKKMQEIVRVAESVKVYREKTEQVATMLEHMRLLFADEGERLAEIQETVEDISRGMKDDREMEILEWLTREQGPGRHHEIRSRRTAGTGRRLLEESTFKDWVNPASLTRLLWCVGGPGCGKSTLMSLVIDEFKTSSPGPEAAVAYYYCDYRARTTEPLLPALGSLIRTLSETLHSLPRSLRTLFDGCRRERRPPMVSELEGILSEICGSLKYPFVLIDALDEFSPSDPTQTTHLVCFLDTLAQKGTRVYVTSRAGPEPSLLTPGYSVVNYTADNADIRTHVAHALHTDSSMVALLDSQLEEDISNTIVSQASGMFLLAVLHLQNIRGQVSRAGIRRSLSTLSRDLGDAYDKTFEAITNQSPSQRQLAFDALLWVASSYRPLSALELRHALATHIGDADWDIDDVSPLGLIVRSCCGLLSVDNMNDDQSEVRLVHHTLQQYLQSRQPTWFARAHEVIVRTSLTCLLFESFGLPAATEKKPFSSFAEAHALVPYARTSWGFHAAMAPLESYLELAMGLFNNKSRLHALYPDNRCISGLHIAAGFGLTDLILHMVKDGLDVETFDGNHQSPLQYACAYNHTETARQLLKLGANPNHLNIKRDTPLFLAVGAGNKELATILLDHGALPGQLARDNWVPLHKAADAGYYDLARILVRRGGSISSRSAKGVTALHRAAGRGHVEIIAFLLSEEASVEATTHDSWTPLHGASSGGQTQAVKLLLQHGANINHRSLDEKVPLHRACRGGHLDTIQTLLDHGADIMAQDADGNLPIHIAAREGHPEVVQHLLTQNPIQQLQHKNKNGLTPLLESQWSGSRDTEVLLLQQEHPSPTNIVSLATNDDNAATLTLLQINTPDSIGRTPLHRALHASSYNTAEALLTSGADIHAQSHIDGWHPIHFAALSGPIACVSLCISHGADINARTTRGQTPLHHACRKGDEDTVRLLLTQGANIRAADDRGWQPLHTSTDAGHEKIVRILLEHKALRVRWESESFQGFAANRGHYHLVELFRELRYSG